MKRSKPSTVDLLRALALGVAAGTFTGCGSLPSGLGGSADGPPPQLLDYANVPDAVPQPEPLSRYGNPESYVVAGRRYHVMPSARGYVERGIASWYGSKFHGRRTSSGERYDMYAMTAAHPTLPIPSYVRVTHLGTGESVIVRVNDRGPFHRDRVIDLSYVAALKLGITKNGTAPVEVRALDPNGTPPPPAPIVAGGSTELFVQVGAFASLDRAEKLRDQLLGIPLLTVHIQPIQLPDAGLVYRVRLGPMDNVTQADQLVELLQTHGISNHRIVVD